MMEVETVTFNSAYLQRSREKYATLHLKPVLWHEAKHELASLSANLFLFRFYFLFIWLQSAGVYADEYYDYDCVRVCVCV